MMIRRALFTLTAVTLLTACARALPPARPDTPVPPPEGAYLAIGTEPFWSLEITASELRYVPANGIRIVARHPGARPSFNGLRYVTDRLSVDVTYAPCSDGMSDRRHADTVSVAVDGRNLKGCGGMALPPADLSGTSWRVLTLSGGQIDGTAPAPHIAFDAAAMRGRIACNNFSLPVRVANDRIVATGKAISTQMRCDDAAMAADAAFLRMFGAPVAIRYLRDGKLLLGGVDGATAVLQQGE